MTENQVTVAIEKFRQYMPVDAAGNIGSNGVELKPKLEAASENCMDALMGIKMKSKIVAILLAMFLGGIGAGRFYIGDKKIGIIRIIVTIATSLASYVPVLGMIVAIVSFGWIIVDIFLVAKRVKQVNFEIVCNFLSYHQASK